LKGLPKEYDDKDIREMFQNWWKNLPKAFEEVN
jgi:hypothetical protein